MLELCFQRFRMQSIAAMTNLRIKKAVLFLSFVILQSHYKVVGVNDYFLKRIQTLNSQREIIRRITKGREEYINFIIVSNKANAWRLLK